MSGERVQSVPSGKSVVGYDCIVSSGKSVVGFDCVVSSGEMLLLLVYGILNGEIEM